MSPQEGFPRFVLWKQLIHWSFIPVLRQASKWRPRNPRTNYTDSMVSRLAHQLSQLKCPSSMARSVLTPVIAPTNGSLTLRNALYKNKETDFGNLLHEASSMTTFRPIITYTSWSVHRFSAPVAPNSCITLTFFK